MPNMMKLTRELAMTWPGGGGHSQGGTRSWYRPEGEVQGVGAWCISC